MAENKCEVAERLENAGFAEGLEQGRKQGIEQGRNEIIYELVEKNIITPQRAAEALKINDKEFEKWLIFQKGVRYGIELGIEQGVDECTAGLVYYHVQKQRITPQQGADELGISVEELREAMRKENMFCP